MTKETAKAIKQLIPNQKDAFYEIGYYDLGDFYLALER